MPKSPPCVCCFSSPPSSWRLGFVVVGSGVSMGPLSADAQPPPSSADSDWFLTQNSGFGDTTDGRRRRSPPLPRPLFFEQETATELGSRFPFFCGFNQGGEQKNTFGAQCIKSSKRRLAQILPTYPPKIGLTDKNSGPTDIFLSVWVTFLSVSHFLLR